MNKKLFTLLITLLTTFCMYAQQAADPVAIKINGKPVLRSELEEAYIKSNQLRADDNKESLSDFVQSYIDFKMNVEEAKAQNLDTTGNYVRDLSTARVEMARKYMQDTLYENTYIQKIYDRLLENVEINHILLPLEGDLVYPVDTVALYNKAMELRAKLLKNGFEGEGYDKTLQTSIMMDNNKRNGYIGWTVPFMFASKVEDAIYTLPINEISQPIRTVHGYHIVQVLGKRPAVGSVEIEQVLFNFSKIPASQHQIDSVGKVAWREYKNIHSSSDFNSLCEEFSRVMETKEKGCYLGFIGLDSPLSPSFVNTAFDLKQDGDVSEPVRSDYGYHIMRLLQKAPVPAYGDIKNALRKRIEKSDKLESMISEKHRNMAADLKLYINKDAYSKLNDITNKVSPKDSAFFNMVSNKNDILFTFNNIETYTVNNFIEYIRYTQRLINASRSGDAPDMFIYTDLIKHTLSTDILREYFNDYLSRNMTNYYYATLSDRFVEYKEQLNSISDELLLFTVKNKNIWDRSVTDEKGLSDYFNKNKSKYSLDGTKYKGLIIHTKKEGILKEIESLAIKEKKRDSLIEKIRNSFNKDSVQVLMEPGLWIKGQNQYVDNKIFGVAKEVTSPKGYQFFSVVGDFISSPQDYTDVRSSVELDYQDALEKEWRIYLRNKYKVETDESVLKTIK
ncbi:MAG: peptidylprolyl isomerase [Prevotella sp.]|nr:peptidylprolyl isomerase [Prevotella sp.]